MYIIYDKETNEYLTDIGWLWLESIGNGPPMGGPPMGLHSSVCVYASEEEARSVLADIFCHVGYTSWPCALRRRL